MLFTLASMHIFSKRDDYQRFAKRRVLLIAVTSSKEMKNEYFFIIPRRELLVTHRYLQHFLTSGCTVSCTVSGEYRSPKDSRSHNM